MRYLLLVVQTLALILAAPLVSGFIRKVKNNLRMRQGASVFQPYYDLAKLFRKEETVSGQASWLFRAAPLIVLASSVSALFLVPAFLSGLTLSAAGDFIAVFFVLALGRFFLSLAGLDAGSSFGGMGSSREMFISALAEPVAFVAVLAAALSAGSTSLETIAALPVFRISSALAFAALFAVTIAETSRVPVDNQETHLELTMVHEAMVLEYSGRSLALLTLAAHVKQIVFFSLLAAVFLPVTVPYSAGAALAALAGGAYAAKIFLFCAALAVLEVSVAKMRLFRVVDFLAFSFVLAMMAVAAFLLGV